MKLLQIRELNVLNNYLLNLTSLFQKWQWKPDAAVPIAFVEFLKNKPV